VRGKDQVLKEHVYTYYIYICIYVYVCTCRRVEQGWSMGAYEEREGSQGHVRGREED
jgi:hypothetical protein